MANMYSKNLRTWQPDDSDAKDVRDTKMLSTTARECTAKDTDNPQTEYINSGGTPQGPFGTRGRN